MSDLPRRSSDNATALLRVSSVSRELPANGRHRDSCVAEAVAWGTARSRGGRVSRPMNPEEMQRLFERHRDAEAARDYDAILATFVENSFLETHPLGLRSKGRAAVRAAYEGYFTAFPDLAPDDVGQAFGDDVMVVWGTLEGTSGGDWMGVPPSGKRFSVPFANVTPFRGGLMEGETIYFDLATLCEQAELPLDEIRAAAKQRAAASG